MFWGCYEPPLVGKNFTPEKGREQLQRMRACYHRLHMIQFGMVATSALLLIGLMIFVALAYASR